MSMYAEPCCQSELESWEKGDVRRWRGKESRGGCTCVTGTALVLDRDDTTRNSTGCVYVFHNAEDIIARSAFDTRVPASSGVPLILPVRETLVRSSRVHMNVGCSTLRRRFTFSQSLHCVVECTGDRVDVFE
jgi:hypothetical protein